MSRYFASGTGAAGLVGALLWWEVRGLGVRTGVGISAVRNLYFLSLCQYSAAQIWLTRTPISGTTVHNSPHICLPPAALSFIFFCVCFYIRRIRTYTLYHYR